MSAFPFLAPPDMVRLDEVIHVVCQRGEGDNKRDVTQFYSKDGVLLAEHDHIHSDPVYASHFLRAALANTAQPATENVAHGV